MPGCLRERNRRPAVVASGPVPPLLHEVLIEMVRDRPALVAELLTDPLGVDMPPFQSARLSANELNNLKPVEFWADAVVTFEVDDTPVLGVVVEVQLAKDKQKRFSWPNYVTTLYARLTCPVLLLIVCPDPATADWAAERIVVGGPGMTLTPLVIGPTQVPTVIDVGTAVQHPELTVLSALRLTDDVDPLPVLEALLSALDAIDRQHADLYADLVLETLPEAARKCLEALMTTTSDGPRYRSDFARRYFAEGEAAGRAEGEAAGRAQALLAVLDARDLPVSPAARTTITECADLDRLDAWLLRAMTVDSVEDLLANP